MSGFLIDAQGPFIESAPGDFRDYSLDWVEVLEPNADSILSSSWTIPSPNTPGPATVNGTVTTQWITSPTVGTYYVSNTMTSVGGRVLTRGFRLIVAEGLPTRP